MKKIGNSIIHKLLIIQLILFFAGGCTYPRLSQDHYESALFYAMPEGGLRLYYLDSNKAITLTEEKDYYPYFDVKTQLVSFIRLLPNEEKEGIVSYSAKMMLMSVRSKKPQFISDIPLYNTSPSLPDQLFYLDGGKILLIQNEQRIRMIEVKTGKQIEENLIPYLPELNQYSQDGKTWYIRIRHGKHASFFKSDNNLYPHQYHDTILCLQADGKMTPCLSIPKDRIYQDYIDGFSFCQSQKILAIGNTGTIELRNEANQMIQSFPGKHPFFCKTDRADFALNHFPFYKVQAFVEFQDQYVFGTLHWAGRMKKGTQDLQLFTDSELSLTSRVSDDTTNLFDHISVIRNTETPPLLVLTSIKDTEKEASASNIMALTAIPDQLLILSLQNKTWTPLLQLGEKISLLMEWKNLDIDDTDELLLQYSASSFTCEGRFQSAGRTLLWVDVYKYHPDTRQLLNDSALYPAVYSDLLKKLEPFYDRALTAIRLKDPILCQDDLDRLQQIIQEAKTYVTRGRG